MGYIGRRVAELAAACGMRITYYSRTPRPELERALGASFLPLPQLFATAEYVSLRVPAGPGVGLVDADVLSCANGIGLINTTSIGRVVEPEALLLALEREWVRKVAIEGRYAEPYDQRLRAYGDDRVLLMPPYTSYATRARAGRGGGATWRAWPRCATVITCRTRSAALRLGGMARPNEVVAALLQEYADLISITGGQAYKARVYEKAARSVAGYHADVSALDLDELRKIPNVGGSIAEKIVEYLHSGQVEAVEQLRAKVPAGVRELTTIPTLGPKKAMLLYQELGVSSVAELVHAIETDQLSGLKGFGAKTAENIQHGIELLRRGGGRVLISMAMTVAEETVAELSALSGCVACTYAGSLRRMRESIGDVDILASARNSKPLMDTFTRLPLVAEVIAHGTTKSSIRTSTGLQMDLRVVPPEVWGAALQYFTGSKAHNIRTREIAVRKGLKLSEYGLFRVEDAELVVAETEQEVYERLGLPWIPPTLREDRGEIEAALAGALPDLLTERDIRGDLHTHTDLTDGVSSLDDMVATGRGRGYRYYAVTDHAKNLPMQRMTDEKMLAQREQLRGVDTGRMALLHGTELNIDPDGGVDWDAEFLSGFDICVASVHSHFQQSQAEMTRRLVRACEHPYVNVIGHPTTRQIGKREPIDADWDAVFEAAARTGTALEVNSYPDRLDLNDELILRAKRYGVKFAVDTDSHSTIHLGYLRYGVGMAQRGWLTADEVINTWPLSKLRQFVNANRRR